MRHYLDHAATTTARPSATTAFADAAGHANPSSVHSAGRAARRALEEAREELAAAVGAHPTEVVFTSGGTEANNLLVLGGASAGRRLGRPRVAASTVEHPAVAEAVRSLGADALWLDVDADGAVTPAALASLDSNVAWASVMWVNNETGAVQPIEQVVAAAGRIGALAHSDAVAALGHVPVDFAASGLDALTLSAHKVGGPVGVGALVVRRGVRIDPTGFGGGQEARLRSGTVPVALAAGFAAAAADAVAEVADEATRLRGLRDRLVVGLRRLDGIDVVEPAAGSPAICQAIFTGCRAEDLLLLLDAAGIDCSTGSACTAGVHEPSRVLLAMGRTPRQAASALRFSFGATTTEVTIDAVLAALPAALTRARAAG